MYTTNSHSWLVNMLFQILKNNYDTYKKELGFPDTSGNVKKTYYNAKTTEIEGKLPRISGLATNAALTAVGNKIPNISSLVKKTVVKKQIKTQKLLKLKRNLLIIIIITILQLQSLILKLPMFLMQN